MNNNKLLLDKVVVVIGGAGLLGREFCRSVVGNGASLVVADQNVTEANKVAHELGGQPKAVACGVDINDPESVKNLLQCTISEFGRVDALVNSAYPRNNNYGRPLDRVTHKDFCENLSLHVGGYFTVMQTFAKYFENQSHSGSIVCLGSIYGTIAPRFDIYESESFTMPVEYAAIKAGIIHLVAYFAQFYKRMGVRFNILSPGGVLNAHSERFINNYGRYTASGGMLLPEQVASVLTFLLSDESKAITGQNFIVDEGFSL